MSVGNKESELQSERIIPLLSDFYIVFLYCSWITFQMRKLMESCLCLVEEEFLCPSFNVTLSHKLFKIDSESLSAVLLLKIF